MSSNNSLTDAVESLEKKKREHEQAQNTQHHLSVAQHNISEINKQLDELGQKLINLKYYKKVLEEGFDGSTPPAIDDAVKKAEEAARVTQADLLENIQNSDVGEEHLGGDNDPQIDLAPEVESHLSKIESAKDEIEGITEDIRSQLRKERESWTTKLETAEELQNILGNQDSNFADTLKHLRKLLNEELMDTSGEASEFVFKWQKSTENWEKHQSLQSFDDFQEKHNLSDSTINDIKTLSKSQRLTLADVSLDSLEEMKRVDELESATELSL
jgi:peptidoglycan hydrolase-like protein with peptidoglycan-binding domain